ncbi:MAG: cytochrome c oxidase subunit I [Nitrosospira sp.]|nr:cytochrome c oxidase subunit I [Nitrosospira sp.]
MTTRDDTAAATVADTGGADRSSRLHHRFEAIWGTPPGIARLSAVNHTSIGIRFIVTGFVFFVLGGLLSMLMRVQLALPENDVLDEGIYRQFFTMHGTTMMFLFAVPILEGFAVYLIPKMIGTRDLVFPRLSAFGYWCYLFGGIFLYSSFFFGSAPDGGWFMYVPLTDAQFSPGPNTDFWLIGVTFAEVSAVAAAIELIVAILKTRAPGMSLDRMPLFAWYILITSFMIIFAFPALILGSILLEIERAFGFVFFDAGRGGHPLLWQHLFWIFGHPEVYIIFLPAAGMLSMIIPTFARRPIAGYTWIVLSVIAIGFLSFGLWVHHMFTVGIPQLALSFFAAASMAIAIPTGIQIFAWIATLWNGRPVVTIPLLFVLGVFFIFVLGGLTGVMLALVPFNWQVHDTHFVVAHLHYVLIGGMVFPLFAGLYYWLPLFSGRRYSESLGRAPFWLMFIGFNVTFLPMHLTGLLGMPRRVHTYAEGLGWDWLNLVSTIGSFLLAAGIALVLLDVILHFLFGKRAHRNPWNAGTLEWAIEAPVPTYNFISIPRVQGRDPLWSQAELVNKMNRGELFLGNPDSDQRELLGTNTVTGEPESVIRISKSTWIPLLTALPLALFFFGLLARVYVLTAIGGALVVVAALVWLWTTGHRQAPDIVDAGCGVSLPIQYASPQAPGWWAVCFTIMADAVLYSSLLFAYFFLWTVSDAWPPADHSPGSLAFPLIGIVVLLASSAVVVWAARCGREGASVRFRYGQLVALVLGFAFLVLQTLMLLDFDMRPQQHAYASLVYTIVGFHLVHIVIAMLMAGFVFFRSWFGYITVSRQLETRVSSIFWHYSVFQWLLGFGVIYLFPAML